MIEFEIPAWVIRSLAFIGFVTLVISGVLGGLYALGVGAKKRERL